MGAKKLLHLFGYWTTSTLNSGRWQSNPNISCTLVHKRLKTGPDFLPTLTILFRSSPSALTWRRTATLDETALSSC